MTEAAASEYSRLLMSSQSNQAGPSSGESGGARLVESRSLTMDMMRAMAAEVARGEQGSLVLKILPKYCYVGEFETRNNDIFLLKIELF